MKCVMLGLELKVKIRELIEEYLENVQETEEEEMKKSPVPIEKGRRIKKRRVMAEAGERVRGLFDELFDKYGEIILDGKRMKRTTDLTCDESEWCPGSRPCESQHQAQGRGFRAAAGLLPQEIR